MQVGLTVTATAGRHKENGRLLDATMLATYSAIDHCFVSVLTVSFTNSVLVDIVCWRAICVSESLSSAASRAGDLLPFRLFYILWTLPSTGFGSIRCPGGYCLDQLDSGTVQLKSGFEGSPISPTRITRQSSRTPVHNLRP